MLRAIAVAGLILGLIAVAVFGPRMLGDDEEDPETGTVNESAAANTRCDLLQDSPCRWSDSSGDWEVSLSKLGEGTQGMEYRLTVVTPEHPERFLAVLRGESMYMGEYPVPLGNQAGNEYAARFTAPFCAVDATMTWRIDLQQGQKPIEGIPVKLVFQAEPH
ncbi:hypothetical protein KEHDKFFH_15100 [Marinobacter maroccanus]|uniref:Uncharacterized protein n=1 Tax=Marinobacter maroccanus TaxID=2055143 RepID=A0A2S5Z7Y0_9GAMM|nr:hypothetical protein [Marinobacter maroccanus]PPI83344.1 hypothetical protein KEHDKFFH_15100 [Marinobacter maroccanus]